MRTRRPSPEHEAAVARRLAALVAELEATRPVVAQSGADPVIAPVADEPDSDETVDECETTVIRLPGRHAARRRDPVGELEEVGPRWATLRERLSALALAPAHLAVVAALVAGGLAVTCWWVVASDPQLQPVAAPVAVAGQDSSNQDAAGTARSMPSAEQSEAEQVGPATTQVVVDVAGEVRRPGIVVLPAGARVVDAVEAAGGTKRGVDLTDINLARLLVDGEQILVGVDVPSGVANGAVPGTPGPASAAGLVNINIADQTLLETLPGVGPVTAAAIIAWRTDNGGFRSVDDLLEVSGIGEATLAKLAPLVTL